MAPEQPRGAAVVVEQPRVLFVNGGILGLISFDHFVRDYLPRQDRIRGERIVLTDGLSLSDRVRRRVLCQRAWSDGWLGIANLDLARYRAELHAGLLARRRIAARPPGSFDVLHFHRQATAYNSLDLMARVPSIVSIDATQQCVIDRATTSVERASYAPNVRRDGAVFRRAAAIVATSQWAAASVRQMYPDCAAPIHVLPNPVLLDYFEPAWIEARAARARERVSPRLLFLGGDFPRKGGYDLLEAWEAGQFAGRATLELITNWPLGGTLPDGVQVTRGIAPHTPEWSAAWARADVFVMPTHNEAFGLVYQEAASAGLPAIGTAHHAVPEIVRHGETGLLVPPGDTAALTTAMRQLVDDAGLRERMGRRARSAIEQEAGPEQYMRALADIVLDVWRRP
jgi:glycosyltransferase involved in cell wall biosynthesis